MSRVYWVTSYLLQMAARCLWMRRKSFGYIQYATETVVTVDSGFANESNMKYLHENKINAYVSDNRYRRKETKFANKKAKYEKRHQDCYNNIQIEVDFPRR